MNELLFLNDFPLSDSTKAAEIESIHIHQDYAEIFIRNVSQASNDFLNSKKFFQTDSLKQEWDDSTGLLKIAVGGIDRLLVYDKHDALNFMYDPTDLTLFLGIGPFGAEYLPLDKKRSFLLCGHSDGSRNSFFYLILGQLLAIKDSKHLVLDHRDEFIAISKIPGVVIVTNIEEFMSHELYHSEDCYKWIDDNSKLPKMKNSLSYDSKILTPMMTVDDALWLYCQLVEKEEQNFGPLDEFYKMLGGEEDVKKNLKRKPKYQNNPGMNKLKEIYSDKVKVIT